MSVDYHQVKQESSESENTLRQYEFLYEGNVEEGFGIIRGRQGALTNESSMAARSGNAHRSSRRDIIGLVCEQTAGPSTPAFFHCKWINFMLRAGLGDGCDLAGASAVVAAYWSNNTTTNLLQITMYYY